MTSRCASLAVAFALSTVVVACATDSVDPDPGPQIAIMRLTVGNQLVSVDASGNVSGGPVVLRAGIAANVTVVWLTASGEPDDRITRAVYQVNATSVNNTPIVFTRSTTDPFAGTIVCNTPNVVGSLRFSLYNVEAQHDLWGPFQVQFVVSN